MIVRTKYNLGQYVYIIDEQGRLCKPMILAIVVGFAGVRYGITGYPNQVFEETDLYRLKREALASGKRINRKVD